MIGTGPCQHAHDEYSHHDDDCMVLYLVLINFGIKCGGTNLNLQTVVRKCLFLNVTSCRLFK